MRKWLIAPWLVMVLALGIVACGGDDEAPSGGTGGGSAESGGDAKDPVKFTFIVDQSGPGGLYGTNVLKGAQYRLDQINAEGGVKGHKLEMEVVDSASDQGQATAAMTKAARGDNDAVLYGVLAQSALALAPIAQREKMPTIISYSQVDEVTAPGDYIYRTTTSEGRYYDGMVKYLAEQKGMKTMSVWFASDNATAVKNTEETMPALAKKYGVKILDNVSVKSTDTDFSSSAAKIADQNPDGVAVLILGKGVNTAITALRRTGYDGLLFGSSALGAGALSAAGDAAAGTYYPASFVPSEELPWRSGVEFLQGFESDAGKPPSAFEAAGHDQIEFLAKAISKIDGEVTSESVHAALPKAASEGFAGATGQPVKFDDQRIAVSPGALTLWDGKDETFAPDQPTPFLEEYGEVSGE